MQINADKVRKHAPDAAQLLKSLAHETRLAILCLLAGGERSVGELNADLSISQSALSQHLAVLRRDRLVTTRRDAQHIHYRLAGTDAARVIEALYGIYCE